MKFGSVGTADSTQFTPCVPRASNSPGPSPRCSPGRAPRRRLCGVWSRGPLKCKKDNDLHDECSRSVR